MELETFLRRRLGKKDLDLVAAWALEDDKNSERLFSLALGGDGTMESNALWCLTHLRANSADWLQSKQKTLIDAALQEKKTSRKRMLLQLLRNMEYDRDQLRGDFLDFCMTKINSDCEPYAIRCFSLYIASKMCRHYPELVDELKECLSMLSQSTMSPGLHCAVRKVSAEIKTYTKL